MDVWERLRAGLGRLAGHDQPPPGGRVGAALVLLHDPGDGDLEFVYTRRREDLRSHPGQISFPGGRVDPGETVEQAAVREAVEEVALDPASVEVLGRLPAFYIPPSRFWLHTVLARWRTAHPLQPAEAEVAAVLRVRRSRLTDPSVWRSVELSHGGHTWAWQLDDRHLLWGATAVATAVVLGLLDPDWSGGVEPGGLAREHMVRPWERAPSPRPFPRRLPGVPEQPLEALPSLPAGALRGLPPAARAEAAGVALADAVSRLVSGTGPGPLVLVGPGGTGVVGVAAAKAMAARGLRPRLVLSRPREAMPEPTRRRLDGLRAEDFAGGLPEAGVVVDALLGAGLRGRLAGAPLAIAHALRHLVVPVVAVDVPSGVHPESGLLGDAITADVTVAFDAPRPGLLRPGMEPFAGDLYVQGSGRGGAPLLRLVRPAARDGWRE